METATDFYDWTFEVRGESCKCVSNHPVGDGDGDVPARATFWSEDEMSFPDRVVIEDERVATGEAPAVDEDAVEGWNRYDVTFAS